MMTMMRYTVRAVKSTTVVEWEEAVFTVVAENEAVARSIAENMLDLEDEGEDSVVDADGLSVYWEEVSTDRDDDSPRSITRVETDWSDRPIVEGLGDTVMLERLRLLGR